MKSYPVKEGPYPIRLVYDPPEIDEICEDALRSARLLPQKPEPVKVDLFLERYFAVPCAYEDLGEGIMGCTVFNSKGAVTGFIISSRIEEEGTKSAERKVRSTLAHEGGHGLLHSMLFMADTATTRIFSDKPAERPRIMCRGNDIGPAHAKPYDGKWWEWQANRAIAGLLLPKKLVSVCVDDLLDRTTMLPTFKGGNRAQAVELLSRTFDVNPVVARIRLEEMFPESEQMLL